MGRMYAVYPDRRKRQDSVTANRAGQSFARVTAAEAARISGGGRSYKAAADDYHIVSYRTVTEVQPLNGASV